jgi:hypothetical protein
MNHNLFISYSRVDSEFALRLVRDLRTLHIEVWFDQIDIPPGASWDDEVERALDQAKIMIVVLSEASGKSQNVRNEIGHALEQGKQIVPVLLSKGTVPLRITRVQREDFSGDYHSALAKLTRRLSGEGKTASLQAITTQDVQREARAAAVRLSAGALPTNPTANQDEGRVRLSEPEALSSLASVTAPPPSRAQWRFQRLLPLGLSLAAVVGAGVAMLRSPAAGPSPLEKSHPAAPEVAPTPTPSPIVVPTTPVDTRSAKARDRPVPALRTEQATSVPPKPKPPTSGLGAFLCRELNFGGVCESIMRNADLRGSQVGNDTVSSVWLGTCRAVRVCSAIEFGGSCAIFKGDKPDLSLTRVGDNTASSIECIDGSVPPVRGALLCQEPGFGGICETLGTSPHLFASRVGNDQVSSIWLGTCREVKVCSDMDFGGECETFTGDQPNLSGTQVGDNRVSSIECIGGATADARLRAVP